MGFRQLLASSLFSMFAVAGSAQTAVHGVVLDATTHQPIARVLVQCDGGAGTLTDKDGQFTLPVQLQNPVPSHVNLQWKRPGYMDPISGTLGSNRLVRLAPDRKQVLTLERTASIDGRVELADGEEPGGLGINLLQAVVTNGRRRWQVLQYAATRSDGTFNFLGLRTGIYRIKTLVSADPAPLSTPQQAAFGYPITYAPGTRSIETATVFRLKPGEQAEARVRLERIPFYPISVLYTGAEPAYPRINGEGGKDWTVYYDMQKHLILAPLPAGSYTLSIEAQGDQPMYATLPLTVKSASATRLTLTPVAAGQIGLETVVDATGSTETNGVEHPSLTYVQFDELTPGEEQLGGPIFTDADTGAQKLQIGLHPGRYWVRAGASGGYVNALEAGGVDLLREPLTITEGQGATLRATIRTDLVAVKLVRKGALANQPCTAHLIPVLPGLDEVTLELGTEGDPGDQPVQLFSTPPGEYVLVATPPNTSIAYREPGVLERLRGARITVKGGETTDLSVSEMDLTAGSL